MSDARVQESLKNKQEVGEAKPSPEELAKIEANKKEEEKRQKEREDYEHARAALGKHFIEVVYPNASEWTYKGSLNDPDLAETREKFKEKGFTGLAASLPFEDPSKLKDGVYGSPNHDFDIIKQGDHFYASPAPENEKQFRERFGAVLDMLARQGHNTIDLFSNDPAHVTDKYLKIALEEIEKRKLAVNYGKGVADFIRSNRTNDGAIPFIRDKDEGGSTLNQEQVRARVKKYEDIQINLRAKSNRAFNGAYNSIAYDRSKKRFDAEEKFTTEEVVKDKVLKVDNKNLEGKEALAALEQQVDSLEKRFENVKSASENLSTELKHVNQEGMQINKILTDPASQENQAGLQKVRKGLNKLVGNFNTSSKERAALVESIKEQKEDISKHVAFWEKEIKGFKSIPNASKEENDRIQKLNEKITKLNTDIAGIDPIKLERQNTVVSDNIKGVKDSHTELKTPKKRGIS